MLVGEYFKKRQFFRKVVSYNPQAAPQIQKEKPLFVPTQVIHCVPHITRLAYTEFNTEKYNSKCASYENVLKRCEVESDESCISVSAYTRN